jgi:hypothetical protein
MGWYYNPIQQQKKDQAVAERERQKTAERQRKQVEKEKKQGEKEERKRNQTVKNDQGRENEQENEMRAIMPRSIGPSAPRRVPVPESFTSAHTSTHHKIAPPAKKAGDVMVPPPTGTENIAGKTPSPPVKTSKQQDMATFLRGLFPAGPARETAREWMREGHTIRFYRSQKNWFMQLDNRHISVDEFLRIVQKDAENTPRALRTINRLSTKAGPTEDTE